MQSSIINFRLPTPMYERFFRLYPGHGERTRFLRDCVKIAIALAGKKDCFKEVVEEKVKKLIDENYNDDGDEEYF